MTTPRNWTDPLKAAKAAKTKALSTALNASLTTIFETAPIQAQVTFSNLAGAEGSVTKLVDAGQPSMAVAALQGMLTDDLAPNKYDAFINPAIAAAEAYVPLFAAVAAASTVAAVDAVSVPPAAPAS